MPQHIHIGNGLPSLVPGYTGQEYFDQDTQQFYKAAGTNQLDWQLLGAGSGGGGSNSFFSSLHTIENIEGPGTVLLDISSPVYSVNMGGPGTKVINLPAGLEPDKRHAFIVYGQNTYGSSISVQIGDGSNVVWDAGNVPAFPTSGDIIEMALFTLNGGAQWYGRILGSY